MCADDDGVLLLAGDGGDQGRLVEAGVFELLHGDGWVGGSDGLYFLEEPGGCVDAGSGLVVAGVKARQVSFMVYMFGRETYSEKVLSQDLGPSVLLFAIRGLASSLCSAPCG